jgi:hypothetical protein
MAARRWAATSNWNKREQRPLFTNSSPPHQLAVALQKIQRYRAALDGVRHDIPNQPLPQPADFGLDLPLPTSADLLWRRR